MREPKCITGLCFSHAPTKNNKLCLHKSVIHSSSQSLPHVSSRQKQSGELLLKVRRKFCQHLQPWTNPDKLWHERPLGYRRQKSQLFAPQWRRDFRVVICVLDSVCFPSGVHPPWVLFGRSNHSKCSLCVLLTVYLFFVNMFRFGSVSQLQKSQTRRRSGRRVASRRVNNLHVNILSSVWKADLFYLARWLRCYCHTLKCCEIYHCNWHPRRRPQHNLMHHNRHSVSSFFSPCRHWAPTHLRFLGFFFYRSRRSPQLPLASWSSLGSLSWSGPIKLQWEENMAAVLLSVNYPELRSRQWSTNQVSPLLNYDHMCGAHALTAAT